MKPVLVTGGAKGLGAEICRKLAFCGHDLVIHYQNSADVALQLAKECLQYETKVETIFGDFSTDHSLNKFIETYVRLFPQTKGLVNNVGNYLLASSSDTTAAQWHDLFQTNFFAPIQLVQAILPSLRAQKGCIVNLGVSGLSRAFTKATAYATTKAALHFYTYSLAKELAPDCVRVNMVSPGYLETSMDFPPNTELPFQRPAALFEVAELIAYLFDAKSSYITGQNIEVAGAVGL